MQDTIADACLRERAGSELAQDEGAYLAASTLSEREREAMRSQTGRLALYRRLVRSNLEGVAFRLLPRTRARLNAACDGAFDAEFARFLEDAPPSTHFLKDVPGEFFAWALRRWPSRASVPPYLVDLGRYELLHFELSSMPNMAEPSLLSELSLDRPVAFSSIARLVRLGAAVQHLSDDPDDSQPPAIGDQRLLMYRDAEHVVRVLELGSLAFDALEAMMAGALLGAAIEGASVRTGVGLTSEVVGQLAARLADLGERGVLLGGC